MRQSVISLALGMLLVLVLLCFFSVDVEVGLYAFFIKPFASRWYFGMMLEHMGLLLFMGTGAMFALSTGNFNLGGEGQVYVAGLLTALLLQKQFFSISSIQFFVTLVIVIVVTMLLGLFSGYLKWKYEIHELLTSFLLSLTLQPLITWLISNPLRDSEGNLLSTVPIISTFYCTRLLAPSPFNGSFFLALLMLFMVAFFFSSTSVGYKMHIAGTTDSFGTYAGFSKAWPFLWGMAVSAGFSGLCGFFLVTGRAYACPVGLPAGIGFSGLSIALIAKRHILALIPAAFFFAWVESASQTVLMSGSVPLNTSLFLQATVFFLISAQITGINPLRMHKGWKK